MIARFWFPPLVSVFALLGLAAVACGGEPRMELGARCSMVACEAGLICDEADGVCKCGASICKEGERCSLEPSPTCISTSCEYVRCERGESCSLDTGICQCGSESCGEGQWCIEGSCVSRAPCDATSCLPGMSCDPGSGLCTCGGEVCAAVERCVDGSCTFDRCVGVSCGANSVCSEADGSCRCGDVDGPLCSTGESCLEDGAAFTCSISTKCEASACGVGTVCDPEDGLCRCGGVGAAFPVCDENQSCVDGRCRGGLLCEPQGLPIVCDPGQSCDPLDGVCKCGGEGGVVCGADEVCSLLAGERSCARRCTLLVGDFTCDWGEACYFDPGQAHLQAFCAQAGDRGLNGPCSAANDCERSLHCGEDERCTQVCAIEDGEAACAAIGVGLECLPFFPGHAFGHCAAR